MATFTVRRSLGAAMLAAIGASVCCVGPLVLLALGIGGAWIGDLTALEPYRPAFIGITVVFFSLAFRELYLQPKACAPGDACAHPLTVRRQRIVFWVLGVLVLGLLAAPWVAPLFY